MNSPGFWDDQERAAKVSSEHARVSRRLEGYRKLTSDFADARELASRDAGEMADEIGELLTPLSAELERLQEAALFDGD